MSLEYKVYQREGGSVYIYIYWIPTMCQSSLEMDETLMGANVFLSKTKHCLHAPLIMNAWQGDCETGPINWEQRQFYIFHILIYLNEKWAK